MSVDFAPIVRSLNGGMVVVTTALGDERSGCLVGFHCQCSIDPPRYAVWLSKANRTSRVAASATHAAIHFLVEGDHGIAALFGGTTGDSIDKFAGIEWKPGPYGVPLLGRCPRRLVGRRVALLDEGSDHVCMIYEPIDVHASGEFAPLRLTDVDDIDAGHSAEEAAS